MEPLSSWAGCQKVLNSQSEIMTMFRFQYLIIGCLSTLSLSLFASTDTASEIQGRKVEIVKGMSKALSDNVKVSKKAARSSAHRSKQVSSPCGCVTLISSSDINPNGYVITEPGIYKLGSNAVFKP